MTIFEELLKLENRIVAMQCFIKNLYNPSYTATTANGKNFHFGTSQLTAATTFCLTLNFQFSSLSPQIVVHRMNIENHSKSHLLVQILITSFRQFEISTSTSLKFANKQPTEISSGHLFSCSSFLLFTEGPVTEALLLVKYFSYQRGH
ncbi:hypothetical protein T07_11197 [Trichinella nelsoni]|uniref:Uncharacterized protein n=1 Tax=Trichinella nelsoni TaxID=6336 RepID=A0A0V0SIQ8_9BILA|nr:hypothetical protein T07_11197 [Trichinella nelsoni]